MASIGFVLLLSQVGHVRLLPAGPRVQLASTAQWHRSQQLTTTPRSPLSRRCMAEAMAPLPIPPQCAQWVGASIAAGWFVTPFVIPAIKDWYPHVCKPSWCPPAGIYAPVWTLLYGLLGYSASLVAASSGAPPSLRQHALTTFAVHFAINLVWSPIFFGARRITLAAWWNVLLFGAACVNVRAFWQVSPLAAKLMGPYMVWCTFATALTFAISSLNRGDAAKLDRGDAPAGDLGDAPAGDLVVVPPA
jgi:tryptophan-rich sensory protein